MMAVSPAFKPRKVTVCCGETPVTGMTPGCWIDTSPEINGVAAELKLPLTGIELGPGDVAVKVRMPLLLSATAYPP